MSRRALGVVLAEVTTTLAWIAGRLVTGTKMYLAHLLYWQRRERKKHDTID